MKYKVGDEVLVKARITSVFSTAYTADCSCDNFYLKNEDILQEPQMTADEAWEIAKRICTSDYDGYDNVFSRNDLNEIFGNPDYSKIMNSFTTQEAKAKIEAWEEEKEIKVGDVVIHCGESCIVTNKSRDDGFYDVLFEDGTTGSYQRSSLKKTGQHIDIEGILKQIRGDE